MRYPSSSKRDLPTAEAKAVEQLPMMAPQPQPSPAVPAEEEESGGNKVGDILEMVKRRSLIIVGVAIAMIVNSAIELSKQPTVYFGNFQLLVEPVNAELADLTTPGTQGTALDYDTQLAVLGSPVLLAPIVEELQDTYPLDFGILMGGLNIAQMGDTKIIQVSFSSYNQAMTKAVLDTLANTYLTYSKEERQTFLQQGFRFVENQRVITQDKVESLQKQLEEFRQVNGFARPEDRSNQLTEQLGQLEVERLEIQQELAGLEASQRNLQTEEGVQALLINDSAYQLLLEEVRKLDTQISLELTRFQEQNAVIQALREQRATLMPLLEQQINNVVDAQVAAATVQARLLNSRLQNIDEARAKIAEEVQNLSALIREYDNIERQLGIEIQSLNNLLQSSQALQIEGAQSEIPWELVQDPFATAQKNDFLKALQSKIMTGIFAGLGVAFALDKLDGSFHTIGALQQKIKLPILGILPFNQQVFLAQEGSSQGRKKKRKLLNRIKQFLLQVSQRFSKGTNKLAIALFEEYDGTVEFFESLRVIQTNMMQIMEERQYRSFVVSSASVGDGKTTLAINWADTAARMGKKVLLIDANFRRPEIHEFLGLHNEMGLIDLLQDPDQDLQGYIQQVAEDHSLFVLAPGKVNDDLTKLLNNARLQRVIAHLEHDFELIILDIPSMLGLADATLFCRNTDALVLVASLHKTKQMVLQETIDELGKKEIPILGLVTNRQKGAVPVLRATISQANSSQNQEEAIATVPANYGVEGAPDSTVDITADGIPPESIAPEIAGTLEPDLATEHSLEAEHHNGNGHHGGDGHSNGNGNGFLPPTLTEIEEEAIATNTENDNGHHGAEGNGNGNGKLPKAMESESENV